MLSQGLPWPAPAAAQASIEQDGYVDELMSPTGSLTVAIAALLLVLGYRLARPSRGREWLAFAAYAAALAVQVLGAHGLLPGAAFMPGAALRIVGAALLVAGLVIAGRPSRARRHPAIDTGGQSSSPRRGLDPIYAGLGMVLVGQLARAPSATGAIATMGALAACALASLPRP